MVEPNNGWCLILALSLGSATLASAAGLDSCPRDEPIQWIADYCMAKIGTDDEIAASERISTTGLYAMRPPLPVNRYGAGTPAKLLRHGQLRDRR